MAAMTFLTYDTLLNLDVEITHVWRSKWTFVKIVYIASKYLAFLDGTSMLILFFNSSLSPSSCARLYSITTYFILAGIVFAEIILLVRTCALWGLSRYVLWYLIAFDVGSATLAIIKLRSSFQNNSIPFAPSPIPTVRRCFHVSNDKIDDAYIDFVCLVVAELNVLFLTLLRGVVHWRRSNSRLVHIFYRDGVLYLVSIPVISALNIAFFLSDNKNILFNMMLEPQRITHAVFASHLILNVRKLRSRNEGTGESRFDESTSASEPVSLQMKTMASSMAYETNTAD
ncbi:hypothetical protein SCHPADRAFT_193679 [Schizopora paradoxa]|uniref:DUF6533 domain-containing protein n=1 Tax=Schizopora paradoxa TaxID=27342 RepID=A0A0H2RYW5_9AGAM|nr:hypothetical protein SCHPADRAFT_193679 [Schizopora paradoxa]